jgi:hypothetical protein
MTITITIDWLVYVYWLVENYVFVRIQELKVQQYYAYYDQLAEMRNCSEPQKEKEIHTIAETTYVSETALAPVVHIESVAMETELDEKAEGLFAELQQELGLGPEPTIEDGPDSFGTYETFEEEVEYEFEYEMVNPAEYADDEVEELQEDCIHMEDLIKDEKLVSPVGYESFASSKILDCIKGPQQWVVSVIGMEEQYIHVSDGKRIWLNIGEKATRIRMNDVLILDVVREEKEVIVQNLVRVETFATDEYLIPDEERYLYEENQRIAI